ncbi:MAG TPA: hypothetical protein ENN80_09835 [Candidatus Hydrogenedentes bacterium]|nr:hypothetical protein [Candidatus Hydrogenedentota bacterium]
MKRLKADLHTHCADDPKDVLGYSAEALIDAAAQLKYDVLAIACHERVVAGDRLTRYAGQRGIVLIPAVEHLVEGKHVLVLNPSDKHLHARTFGELRRARENQSAVIAPHPYFHTSVCLGAALRKHIDVFDAIEYSSFYFRWLNLNRKAVRVAEEHGLPVIGTSDAHRLYSDDTFTWIDAEPAAEAVIEAVRAGRVELSSKPQALSRVAWMAAFSGRDAIRRLLHRG